MAGGPGIETDPGPLSHVPSTEPQVPCRSDPSSEEGVFDILIAHHGRDCGDLDRRRSPQDGGMQLTLRDHGVELRNTATEIGERRLKIP